MKNTISNAFFWSALDKIGVQASQFTINIILARLLYPEDFGLIGMLSIFLTISNMFNDKREEILNFTSPGRTVMVGFRYDTSN